MPATKKNPVTQEARDAFPIYVQQWQDRLGLNDWRIVVSASPCRGHMAEVSQCDYEARLATIRLGVEFGGSTPVTPESVESTALHEVLHVFLAEMKELYRNDATGEDVLRSIEHRVVNTLERVLMERSQ